MTEQGDPRNVVRAVQAALDASPAYHQLDAASRAEMDTALGRIRGAMGMPPQVRALEDAPNPSAGSGTVGRVGEVARATLGAIDFPSFVSALIQGTFQAIVDATIEQLNAYSTLLQEVAKTVDDYMQDNVTEDSARDYLADRYGDVFIRDTSSGTAQLDVNRANSGALPTFLQDLGFDSAAQIDPTSVEQVVVPAARKTMAEQRHQTLATMVLMGLNRIVVDDGEINAKLVFHIDASETTSMTFDNTQTTMGNMAGSSGGGSFSGQAIMVNTTNMNAQSDINVRADLTGEVRVKFRSDVIPLERFADSNAIQLINQHATVPERRAVEAEATPVDEAVLVDDTTEAQALPPASDPWSPRS